MSSTNAIDPAKMAKIAQQVQAQANQASGKNLPPPGAAPATQGVPAPQVSPPAPAPAAAPSPALAPATPPPGISGAASGALQAGMQASGSNMAQAANAVGQGANIAQQGIQRARQSGYQAAVEAGKSQENRDKELDNIYADWRTRAEELDNTEAQIRQQAKSQADSQLKRLNEAANNVQNFQFKDYFEDKSTFTKIMGVCAAALGGASNALAGQPGAPTPLDKIIAADYQMQQAKYQQLKENVSDQKSIFQTLRENTQDEMSASVAWRAAVNNKVKMMLDQLAAKSNTPAQVVAQLKSQIDMQTAQMQERAASTFAGQISTVLSQTAGLDKDYAKFHADLAAASEAAQAKYTNAKPNQAVINKQSDVDRAIGKIDEALKNPHVSPADQRDLAESVAAGLNNSPTRGPQIAEREVAKSIVSGALPGVVGELKTSIGGINAEKLRQIRAELIQKQRLRSTAAQGGQIYQPPLSPDQAGEE